MFQPWNSNRRPTNISNLEPRDTSTHRGRNGAEESAAEVAMIEGWNSKHLWKRVCMQAAREAHFAVSLTAGTELADGSKSPGHAD